MRKTTFERNVEELFGDRIRCTSGIRNIEKFFQLFGSKTGALSDTIKLCDGKNAIVLLGLDNSGKSTYGRKLLEKLKNKSFKFISMDDFLEANLKSSKVRIDNLSSLTEQAYKMFGEELEKEVNVIIDGNWLPVKNRAALFKTLRELEFKIITISFLSLNRHFIELLMDSKVIDILISKNQGWEMPVSAEYSPLKKYSLQHHKSEEEIKYYFRHSFEEEFNVEKKRLETVYNAQIRLLTKIEKSVPLMFYYGIDSSIVLSDKQTIPKIE